MEFENLVIEAQDIRPRDIVLTQHAEDTWVVFSDVVVETWEYFGLTYVSVESTNSFQFPRTQLVTVLRKA